MSSPRWDGTTDHPSTSYGRCQERVELRLATACSDTVTSHDCSRGAAGQDSPHICRVRADAASSSAGDARPTWPLTRTRLVSALKCICPIVELNADEDAQGEVELLEGAEEATSAVTAGSGVEGSWELGCACGATCPRIGHRGAQSPSSLRQAGGKCRLTDEVSISSSRSAERRVWGVCCSCTWCVGGGRGRASRGHGTQPSLGYSMWTGTWMGLGLLSAQRGAHEQARARTATQRRWHS